MDKLSKKAKGFVKDYIETGNGTQSALNNYDTKDPSVAAVIASENLTKPKIQEAIRSLAERIDDDTLYEVLTDGLKATSNEKPDFGVRHRYLDTALKIKGTYGNEDGKINILIPVLVKFLNKDETDNNGDTN